MAACLQQGHQRDKQPQLARLLHKVGGGREGSLVPALLHRAGGPAGRLLDTDGAVAVSATAVVVIVAPAARIVAVSPASAAPCIVVIVVAVQQRG